MDDGKKHTLIIEKKISALSDALAPNGVDDSEVRVCVGADAGHGGVGAAPAGEAREARSGGTTPAAPYQCR